MSHLDQIPPVIAFLISGFVLLGTILTLLGTIGLIRLGSFYERLHAPTLGTSWGAAGILIGSMLMFSTIGSRWVIHEIFLGCLIMLTMPVTLMVLGRAALHRDRAEGRPPRGTEGPQEPLK
ncbi:monovalent cation/H(+) antiporter subunit G [Paracoccus sp. MC1862]|uniref:monovalent cation/H(+) antiporter subunit G n=1 Tax=Paracoccus sp. MC1862 TaxID=2760307 RepID=UPI0015FFEE19|nr:monovalent cation/H(+) antiporter subunit G [Paracoccus sp. MC1862]MBB1497897.1 cation:proton antiporter [Paracoccus sp. MC1862]QQO44291.1 cation:proton antiporter [Paracoccus sp. MC1862]